MPTLPLSEDTVREELTRLPGWRVADGKLEQDLEFESFPAAFAFMTAAALLSERLDHHPDWWNSYKRVRIQLISHDAGGITARDLRWAKESIELARQCGGAAVVAQRN